MKELIRHPTSTIEKLIMDKKWAFVEQPQAAIWSEVVPPHELGTIFAAAR
jgi:hypothetical protein